MLKEGLDLLLGRAYCFLFFIFYILTLSLQPCHSWQRLSRCRPPYLNITLSPRNELPFAAFGEVYALL